MNQLPFDGIVTKCVVNDLSSILVGGRIEKIFQPEADEIFINIRSKGQNYKLVMSASASYPRIHLTDSSKENPNIPPVFCMLLRKHISGGKILSIDFFDFERIIAIQIESTTELGDLTVKKLIIEIMGRYSNVILVNSEDKIIDSIKHVDNEISSVREVMPARHYVLPPSQDKTSPEQLSVDSFLESGKNGSDISIEKYLLNTIKGFSPLICREICFRAEIDGRTPVHEIRGSVEENLKKSIREIIENIINNKFSPCIIFDSNSFEGLIDFHCINITGYPFLKTFTSISSALDYYYTAKDSIERLKQKKSDVLKVINNNLGRCNKKIALQNEKLRDVADREKLKLYGELITANIYCMVERAKRVSLLNYYSEGNEYIDILLDEQLTPQANAQRYFKQYSKAKSAFSYTSKQLEDSIRELEYLESVLHLLENCINLQEIDEVRQELVSQGYMASKKIKGFKKQIKLSVPHHFISSDGFDIFVGKNNRQNDQLTLKTASSADFWLHTRNIPGSHVIIKKQQGEIPDSTLLEAAILSAYHSKAKLSSNVPVDYTIVRNVKKPGGAKPGMVIYENFKTLIVTPDENLVNKLRKT